MAESSQVLLQATGLGRRIPRLDFDWLFQNVNLEICGGSRIALGGKTGSGKSLLLRSLSQLDVCEAGDIRWKGRSVRGNEVPDWRRLVVYVAQRSAFVDGTVEDNLRWPFSFSVYQDREFDPLRLMQWLTRFGRDGSFLAQPASELSGGERQLVCLLRILQLEPQVLLLDEPTAAMDARTRAVAESVLLEWFQTEPARRAWVLVSHDPDQRKRLCTTMREMTVDGLIESGNDEDC